MSEILRCLQGDTTENVLLVNYGYLEKRLNNILGYLFSNVSHLDPFDWLFAVLKNPVVSASLGMPAKRNETRILEYLKSSGSGFSSSVVRLLGHRIYSIIQILLWILQNPLRPQWIDYYAVSIKAIYEKIKKRYVIYEEPSEDNIMKGWRISSPHMTWDNYHDGSSIDISYLLPTLLYLNDPALFGTKAKVLELNEKAKYVLEEFLKQLDYDLNNGVEIFKDFSKLLWCINTLLVNPQVADGNKAIVLALIDQLVRRWDKDKNKNFEYSAESRIKMSTPELFEPERTLFYSAGWGFELELIIDNYRKKGKEEELKGTSLDALRSVITDITTEAITRIGSKKYSEIKAADDNSELLYYLCQRVWFYLECSQFRAISSALELSAKTEAELEASTETIKIDGGEKTYYYHKERFWKKFISPEPKIILKINIDNIMKADKIEGQTFSSIVLGGSGIGKTSIANEVFIKILQDAGCPVLPTIRITPNQCGSPEEIFRMIENIDERNKMNNPVTIFFMDELHTKVQGKARNPFELLLDPLREAKIGGKLIGDIKRPWKVIYLFASSTWISKDQFQKEAQELIRGGRKIGQNMNDFGTRIRNWIVLPSLWQVPEQKFIVAYQKLNGREDKTRRLLATLATIDSSLHSTADIETSVASGQFDNKEAVCQRANKSIRGNFLYIE